MKKKMKNQEKKLLSIREKWLKTKREIFKMIHTAWNYQEHSEDEGGLDDSMS